MTETLQYAMNRLAGTLVGDVPTLDAQGAANQWAGTSGLGIVGALNVKAGNTLPNYLELQGVLNQLAGTSGLGVDAAATAITGNLFTNGNFSGAPSLDDGDNTPPPTFAQWVPNFTDTVLTWDNTVSRSAPASLKLHPTGAGASGVYSPSWNVTGGVQYTITFYMRGSSTLAASWDFGLHDFDAAATNQYAVPAGSTTSAVQGLTTSFVQHTLSRTASPTATRMCLFVNDFSNVDYYVDDIVVSTP